MKLSIHQHWELHWIQTNVQHQKLYLTVCQLTSRSYTSSLQVGYLLTLPENRYHAKGESSVYTLA